MKMPARIVAGLLLFMLTGCNLLPLHRNRPAQVRILAPAAHHAHDVALIPINLPLADSVIPGQPVYNIWEDAQPIVPPVRRHKTANPADMETAPEPAPSSAAVSAIGELSSGDGTDSRWQTENSISDVERRLNGIHRPLSNPEARIADHIREFLKQARAALASGDVEGARTLTTKAQVLLAELIR